MGTLIEIVIESLVNGQFKQFNDQVKDYNLETGDFFRDIVFYLDEFYLDDTERYKMIKSILLHLD